MIIGRRVNIATIELIIKKNMMYLQFLIPKMLLGIPWLEKLLMHMITLINKKLSINILNHEFKDLSSELEAKLELLAKHILFDQNKNQLSINLKLISSNEMMKLNDMFR